MQNYAPYNGAEDYSWCKMIYTASELLDAGLNTGMITGIGFEVGNNPALNPVFNQQVFIRNTVTNVYTTADVTLPDESTLQAVYQANYTWHGTGWNNVMFNSPFFWDGSSSIEILWENWDGFFTTSYPSFTYTMTPGPMAVIAYDSISFPLNEPGTLYLSRPNLRIITTEPSLPEPAVLVSPVNGDYAFSNVALKWNAGQGLPSSYNIYFGTSNNPPFLVNQYANIYSLTGLTSGTTYYWKIVPENSLGQATDCPVWSFSTPGANQLAQSFETSVPPPGWVCQGANSWTRSTLRHTDGTASAYIDGNAISQYTLSTPKLNISAGSTIAFDILSRFPYATIQLIYSSDRVNWNMLQDVQNNDGNTWEHKIVSLSPIPGNYYLGFRTSLASDDFYLDAVIGPQLVSQIPGQPQPTSPVNMATNVSIYPIFTWNNPSSGGVPTGYNIYMDENNPPSTSIGSATGNIYMMNTPLEYNSIYYWVMTATNEAGESAATSVQSFTTMTDPTVNDFPWFVDFGTEPADWPVPDWTQLKGIYPTPNSTGSQWSRDDWVNVPANNNAARMNVFGTQRYGWLISPPINIPNGGYELQFSLGLTDYTNPSPIEDPTAQQDDKFIVAMSDTRNMANPVVLREWNNAGSEYVYNEIPHTGLVSNILLSGISGIKYFAFYGESTLPGGDNDLYVDNISVREVPGGGHLAISPSEWDYGQVLINQVDTKTFIVVNDGFSELCIDTVEVTGQFFSLSAPFIPLSLDVGETYEFSVQYAPSNGGSHTGFITLRDNYTTTNVNLSAYCHDPIVSIFPWSEDFGDSEEDWPLPDWAQYYGPFPNLISPFNSWVQDNWLNQLDVTNKAARIHVNTNNYSSWFITPGFNIPGYTYDLNFDLALTFYNSSDPIVSPEVNGDEIFLVAMSTSPTMADLVVLREWNNAGSTYRFNDIPHTGTLVRLPLTGFSGLRYFAFYLECNTGGGNFDDLMIDNIGICNPLEITDNDSPAAITTGITKIYPSPSKSITSIIYDLQETGHVVIEIYNIKGQLVKHLVKETKSSGEHIAHWNGDDDNGNQVGTGIFFAHLKSNGTHSIHKLLIVK